MAQGALGRMYAKLLFFQAISFSHNELSGLLTKYEECLLSPEQTHTETHFLEERGGGGGREREHSVFI